MEDVGLSTAASCAASAAASDDGAWIAAALIALFPLVPLVYGLLLLWTSRDGVVTAKGGTRASSKAKAKAKGGPVIWPVVGSFLELRRNYHRLEDWYLGFFSDDVKTWKLRIPFPLSQTLIATVDPVNVEYILTNIHKYGKGTADNFRLQDFLGSGIFLSDGAAWRRHRKIASTEFSTRKLRELSNTVFREDAIKLANVLKQFMAAGKPVEFQSLAARMTLDSICKVAFGVELGGISPDLPDIPFAEAFDAAQVHLSERLVDPLFPIKRLLNVGAERRYRQDVDVVNQFAYGVINRRREEIAQAHEAGRVFDREDLLSKFMAHGRAAEDSYSDPELRDVTVDFLLAGRDTTAVTLAWFMYEMCRHPEMVEKIFNEGIDVVGKKHSGTDFESMAEHLTPDNLSRMHYLHAALSESLRIHPPKPRDAKTALIDDTLPDGTVVKKGELVQYVPYCMARMPFIWGSDALEMKPERWLRDGVFHPVSPFKFTVFQAGPRICLGRDSAFLQLKVTVALIIHFFTFQLVPGQELTYTSALLMPMKNGIQVTVSPRE